MRLYGATGAGVGEGEGEGEGAGDALVWASEGAAEQQTSAAAKATRKDERSVMILLVCELSRFRPTRDLRGVLRRPRG